MRFPSSAYSSTLLVRGCGLGNINVHARPAGKGRICRIQNRLWFSCTPRASRRTQHLVRHPLGEAEAAASGAFAGRRLSSRFELNSFERIEANGPSVGARFGSGPHRAWIKEGWRRRQRARVCSQPRGLLTWPRMSTGTTSPRCHIPTATAFLF